MIPKFVDCILVFPLIKFNYCISKVYRYQTLKRKNYNRISLSMKQALLFSRLQSSYLVQTNLWQWADAYPKLLCEKWWELYKDATKIFILKHFSLEGKKSLEATNKIFYQNKDFRNNQKIIKVVTFSLVITESVWLKCMKFYYKNWGLIKL